MNKQQFSYPFTKNANGFTLVEVMVVIVILSVFAGMMTLSVGSSDNRKNLAFYEHLQSNIRYVRLLSAEQMQPFGLAIRLAKNDNPTQIVVVKLQLTTNAKMDSQTKSDVPQWQLDNSIPPLDVPSNITVNIRPLDNMLSPTQVPNYLIGNQAPPVVWFGTGEATAVQIDVNKTNSNDDSVYPVAEPIIIDNSGAIQPIQSPQ